MFNKLIKYLAGKIEMKENEKLSQSLNKRILSIRRDNKEKIMQKRILPYCRREELKRTGLIKSDRELWLQAEKLFHTAILGGYIDVLNNIVNIDEITSEI